MSEFNIGSVTASSVNLPPCPCGNREHWSSVKIGDGRVSAVSPVSGPDRAAGGGTVSVYANDPRVRFDDDGTATLLGGAAGDWLVAQVGDEWSAWHQEQGRLRDVTDGRYPAGYDTRDEVLAHLLDPAEVTA